MLPDTDLGFPPAGRAYRENGEAHRIWRGLLEAAPDAVIVRGRTNAALVSALEGRGIPAHAAASEAEVNRLRAAANLPESDAHKDMNRRLSRSPRDLANQLAGQYGSALQNVVYIEAFALWGHLRLGRIKHVKALLEPFLSGEKDSLAKTSASHYSGHLLIADYARRTQDKRAAERVLAAARRAAEEPFDNEMSDSVFMVCPLVAAAGMTDVSEAHFDRMRKMCARPDGIWRHSPMSDAAWGRGNAFALLGLALALSYLPAGASNRLQTAYRDLAERLVTFQDDNGLWHQVIDRNDSYAEYSATAMIALALERGTRRRWLPRKQFSPPVQRAWTAIKRRTSFDGELMDVCESTGKQTSVEAYLDREAIFARDPRGGAMALMLSTELAGL